MNKLVTFTRPWKLYSPGDLAGFDAEQADALVKAGVAESTESTDEPQKSAQKPKAALKPENK